MGSYGRLPRIQTYFVAAGISCSRGLTVVLNKKKMVQKLHEQNMRLLQDAQGVEQILAAIIKNLCRSPDILVFNQLQSLMLLKRIPFSGCQRLLGSGSTPHDKGSQQQAATPSHLTHATCYQQTSLDCTFYGPVVFHMLLCAAPELAQTLGGKVCVS